MSKPGRFERSLVQQHWQLWRPTITTAIVLVVVFYSIWQSRQLPTQVDPPGAVLPPAAAESPTYEPPDGELSTDKRSPSSDPAAPVVNTIVSKQTIRNLDGRVAYRGDIDVGSTLQRIKNGDRLEFPNDGSTFQNRERKLPRQRSGYYKEYVHPTPSLRGPGPQRIVIGERGEIYYTSDHYRTFQRLNE